MYEIEDFGIVDSVMEDNIPPGKQEVVSMQQKNVFRKVFICVPSDNIT